MELLRTMNDRGYPKAYLLTRVTIRCGYLIDNWEQLVAVADPLAQVPAAPNRRASSSGLRDGAWESVLAEYAWVYAQMENGLRRILAPVFALCELRTIQLILRHRAAGDESKTAALLAPSLLAEGVQRSLKADNLETAVGHVAQAIASDGEAQRRLMRVFRDHGPAGFEAALTGCALSRCSASCANPLVRDFFRSLVDALNLLALGKHLRWKIKAPLHAIDGGSLPTRTLQETLDRGEDGLARLLDRSTGTRETVDSPEHRLLAGLGRRLRRLAHEPSGIGPILDYFWRLAMEGRNLRLLSRWQELDREYILREMVI